MSISELNHFMTYVIEGWMLFSAGFISTTFVAFVSKRMQEDIAAAALAELQAAEQTEEDVARLEEVAAVSEKLAQTKEKTKQSNTSSVSVST